VVGAANNILLSAAHGLRLHERGILYGPDFCVNAGGIIFVAGELRGDDLAVITQTVQKIGQRTAEIWRSAEWKNCPPERLALERASEPLGAVRAITAGS
jgi:leucine dehydrogenase